MNKCRKCGEEMLGDVFVHDELITICYGCKALNPPYADEETYQWVLEHDSDPEDSVPIT